VLYCSYCIVLHCTVLCHHTALYCSALQCTSVYCTTLYCTVLHCTVCSITPIFILLNWTVLHCTVLYCSYCIVLHCTVPSMTNNGVYDEQWRSYFHWYPPPYVHCVTRTCSQRDPTNVRNYLMRGNILFRKNKYSEALADFTEVLNADPTNVECLYNRGVYVRTISLYFMSFDIIEWLLPWWRIRTLWYWCSCLLHIDAFRCTCVCVPHSASPLYHTFPLCLLVSLGVSHSKLGQHQAAIVDLSAVLNLCPTHYQAAFER
jgi:TPR repeat